MVASGKPESSRLNPLNDIVQSILAKAGLSECRDLLLFKKDLAQGHMDFRSPLRPNIRVISSLDSISEYFGHASHLLERIRRSDFCFVAERNGEMYGYCWVTFRRTPVAEIRGEIEPGANEAYLYDGFVVPRRRGKGVLRQLYAEIFTWLRDRGYRAALGVVLASNTPSVRAIRHEWSLVGKVSYFRLLQFEQYKYDKENPELSRFTLEQPVKTIP